MVIVLLNFFSFKKKYYLQFFTGCIAALCTFVLSTRHLVLVYLYLLSVGIIFVSYWSNASTTDTIISHLNTKEQGTPGSIIAEILNLQFSQLIFNGPGLIIIQNYLLQSVLAYLFCYMHRAPKFHAVQRIIAMSFTIPCHAALYPLPVSFLFIFVLIN